MQLDKLMMTGGIVALPLFAFSAIVIALVVERLLFWYRLTKQQNKIINKILYLYQEEPAYAVAFLRKNLRLPITRIFLEALEIKDSNPEVFRLALESATEAEVGKLKQFTTVFETIIATSPLLGLMGTILGLMRSFSSLQIGDLAGSNASEITGGISEALVSTVIGLAVAIFTLIFFNMFRGFYRQQLSTIYEYTGQLELLFRLKYEKGQHNYHLEA